MGGGAALGEFILGGIPTVLYTGPLGTGRAGGRSRAEGIPAALNKGEFGTGCDGISDCPGVSPLRASPPTAAAGIALRIRDAADGGIVGGTEGIPGGIGGLMGTTGGTKGDDGGTPGIGGLGGMPPTPHCKVGSFLIKAFLTSSKVVAPLLTLDASFDGPYGPTFPISYPPGISGGMGSGVEGP